MRAVTPRSRTFPDFADNCPAWPEYDGEKPSYLELGAEIREGLSLGDDICDSLDRFTLRAYSTGKDKD